VERGADHLGNRDAVGHFEERRRGQGPSPASVGAALADQALGPAAAGGAAATAQQTLFKIGYIDIEDDPHYEREFVYQLTMPNRTRIGIPDVPRYRPLPGAELGIAESNQTGAFSGAKYELVHYAGTNADDLAKWIEKARAEQGVNFFLIDADTDTIRSVSQAVRGQDVLLVNVTNPDDRLRGAFCSANLAHTAPSYNMLTDAVTQYLVFQGWVNVLLITGPRDEDKKIADALKRGAAGVIFESEGFTGTFDAPVPHRAVMGLKPLVGPLASAFYGHPSDALTSIAVTGTNGKTTCAYWSALGMQALGYRAALVGTLGAGFVDALESTGYTTPDAVLLQQRLAQLRADGADALAIEASSIGLDERRLLGMRFDVAVFTNLTRDHLDWHGSMEAYEASKAALFDWPGLHGVVINVDDAAGQRYWQRVQQRPDIARLRCIAYSIAGAFGANLRAENIAPQAAGTRFEVVHGSERHQVTIGVIGDYNVANWLACLGALLALPPRAGAAKDHACYGVRPA